MDNFDSFFDREHKNSPEEVIHIITTSDKVIANYLEKKERLLSSSLDEDVVRDGLKRLDDEKEEQLNDIFSGCRHNLHYLDMIGPAIWKNTYWCSFNCVCCGRGYLAVSAKPDILNKLYSDKLVIMAPGNGTDSLFVPIKYIYDGSCRHEIETLIEREYLKNCLEVVKASDFEEDVISAEERTVDFTRKVFVTHDKENALVSESDNMVKTLKHYRLVDVSARKNIKFVYVDTE